MRITFGRNLVQAAYCRLPESFIIIMATPKGSFVFGRRFDCAECTVKDRPILIVGSSQFTTKLLVSYIQANKPAETSLVERLEDVPHPGGMKRRDWRLIFIDCSGMPGEAITTMLRTEAAPYLQHDIIALFNLTQGNADIGNYIDLGVKGFFFENDQPDILLKGICALKFGEMWVARGVLMEYICQKPRSFTPQEQAGPQLTRREREILVHLSSGATNEEIAAKLFISMHTVKSHIFHICKKLKVHNRLQAAMWAAKHLK